MQINCTITNHISSLITDTLIFDIGLSIIPIPSTYTHTFHQTTNPLTKTNLDQTYYGLWILSSLSLYLLCVIHCRDLADYRQAWGISHDFKRTVRGMKKAGHTSQLAHGHNKWKSFWKLLIIPLISADKKSENLDWHFLPLLR